MRVAAIVAFALLAAPAFAQKAENPGHLAAPIGDPPPEGFYRNVPNAYDLLARLQPVVLTEIREICILGTKPGMSREEQKTARDAFNACVLEWQKQRGGRLYPYATPSLPRRE